jgi:hypothetical protein
MKKEQKAQGRGIVSVLSLLSPIALCSSEK